MMRRAPREEAAFRRRGAFTLVEVMLAVVLLSVVSFVCFFTFNTIVRAWNVSTEVADSIQRADYALSQVTSALRSAWCPSSGNEGDYLYGFMLVDDGDDDDSCDSIQWTKLGSAIVGTRSVLSETPHTVRVWAQAQDGEKPGGLWVKAGQLDLILEDDKEDYDFNDDDVFEPYVLVPGVQGFNCRVLDKNTPYNDDGTPNWQDEWITSNMIPRAVELTFTLEPAEERGEPIRVRRVVEIPLWDLSQNSLKESTDGTEDGRRRRGGKDGEAPPGGAPGGAPPAGGPPV